MATKLGYLVPEFPTQTHVFFWREIEELRKLGIEPVLFSTRKPPADRCRHPFAGEAVAATTYLIPPSWRASLATLLLHPLGFINALCWWVAKAAGSLRQRFEALGALVCAAYLMSECRRRGVEHIHVHSCADAALIALLCRKLGGPTYSLTLHNPLNVFGRNQPSKWGHASFGVVITQRLRREVGEQLNGHLPKTILVAPMGVDLDRFCRSLPYRPWQPGDGPCRIFSCGRLNPIKGYDLLIEAIAILRRGGADVRLVIAGEDMDSVDGHVRRELEARREELGLTEYVSLPGTMSEDDVRGQLEQAHVFVLASRDEPLGVVFMEAMAMGVPVIGTAVGGVGEIIRDGVNGLLVPPRDPAAIAAAVDKLLSRPETAAQFGIEGRKTVERQFGSGQSAKAIVEGLKQVK